MINATRYRLTAEMNRQAALAREIVKLETQISTRKRIQAPSDDPVASARLAEIGRTQADQKAWLTNLGTAKDLADDGYVALGSLMTEMDRAMEQVSSAGGAASDESRAAALDILNDVLSQIDVLAARRDNRGEPLFRTTGPLEIPVGPNLKISAVATREAVFGPIDTPGGPMELREIVQAAIDAVSQPDRQMRDAALASALDLINAGSRHVALMRGDQNIRGQRIASLTEELLENELRLTDQRGVIEDTDLPAAISKVEAARLSLEAAQAVFARVNEKTLFDYLR